MTTTQPPASEALQVNVGPDGERFPFGKIVRTHRIGPYAITEYVNNLDGRTLFGTYVLGEVVQTEGWDTRRGMRRTGHSHHSLDAALVFLVAYRAQGPNVAGHVASHYVHGLGLDA